MKSGNQNEHAFDCVSFMALSVPHRWDVIADFMEDRNDFICFSVPLSNEFMPVQGTVGFRPDDALISKESFSEADERLFEACL